MNKFFRNYVNEVTGFIITLTVIALFVGAFQAQKIIAADRATEFIGSYHIGENITYKCDKEEFVVLIIDNTAFEVNILHGSIYHAITDKYHPAEQKPTTFVEGCLKVEIVKDPNSYWMLNVYAPPATK